MKSLYLTLLALFLVVGCAPKEPQTSSSGDATTGSPSSTSSTGSSDTPGEQAKLTAADLPAAVKHEAFEYFGLSGDKSMGVELRLPGQPTKTGGVSSQIEKVDKDKAFFKVLRTGGIAADLGDDSVEVDATGVYMAGTSIGTITPERFLALPADPTPGKTWTLKTKVVRNDQQQIEEDSVYKVQGIQEVTTKAGKHQALLVTSDGTAVVSMGDLKEKAKYQTKSWYVKGLGPVKIEITLTSPGKSARTLVVEQTS